MRIVSYERCRLDQDVSEVSQCRFRLRPIVRSIVSALLKDRSRSGEACVCILFKLTPRPTKDWRASRPSPCAISCAKGSATPRSLALGTRSAGARLGRRSDAVSARLPFAGYPIGSLLVCQVTGLSRVMRIDDEQREAVKAAPNVWQLVDGQQRINALFSIFSAKASFGRFFLDLTVRRPAASGPVTRRRAKDQGLEYIHWYEASEPPNGARSNWLDVSRWYQWAEADGGRNFGVLADELRQGRIDVVRVLNEIDPDFAISGQRPMRCVVGRSL